MVVTIIQYPRLKMFKVKNLTGSPRKIREHKSGKCYFVRAGEEIIMDYPPVVANPHFFKVTYLNRESNETEKIDKKEEEEEPIEKRKETKFKKLKRRILDK